MRTKEGEREREREVEKGKKYERKGRSVVYISEIQNTVTTNLKTTNEHKNLLGQGARHILLHRHRHRLSGQDQC